MANLITEAFNPNNDMTPGQRVAAFGIGIVLVPAHIFDRFLKKHGLDSDGELEVWETHIP